ncbi:hypothetical protein ACFX1R_006662 [Malus domestica]
MIGSAWAEEVAWNRQLFGLPRLGCLLKMRKLLEFDFSTTIDGAVKDEATKIRVAEDEVSDERTVKCKSGCCPLTICCLVDLQAFDLLNYVAFSH